VVKESDYKLKEVDPLPVEIYSKENDFYTTKVSSTYMGLTHVFCCTDVVHMHFCCACISPHTQKENREIQSAVENGV
jgi:hypothetical protein